MTVQSAERGNLGGKLSRPHRSNAVELRDQYLAARKRVDINAKLCAWLIDLTARVKQQQTEIVYGDFSRDPRELKREFERCKLAISLHKRVRR